MRDATITSGPLAAAGPGARRLAVTCAHATTEFIYLPTALPSVLWLSEEDAARMVIIRHEATGHCGCAVALRPLTP